MARTTSDPKPFTIAIRLSSADMAALKAMARKAGTSKGEVIRTLIRGSGASHGKRRR